MTITPQLQAVRGLPPLTAWQTAINISLLEILLSLRWPLLALGLIRALTTIPIGVFRLYRLTGFLAYA